MANCGELNPIKAAEVALAVAAFPVFLAAALTEQAGRSVVGFIKLARGDDPRGERKQVHSPASVTFLGP